MNKILTLLKILNGVEIGFYRNYFWTWKLRSSFFHRYIHLSMLHHKIGHMLYIWLPYVRIDIFIRREDYEQSFPE